MNSGTTKYLIDSNAVRGLSIELLESKKNNNRNLTVIQEVCDEVPGLKHKLAVLRHETLNHEAYVKMREILKERSVRDVIDYPLDKGAADVALLAHALTFDSNSMFKDQIVIVTDDIGLQKASNELNIDFLSIDDFKVL